MAGSLFAWCPSTPLEVIQADQRTPPAIIPPMTEGFVFGAGGLSMAKGQLKTGRDQKKPKQDKSGSTKPLSAYKQSMAGTAPASFLGKKK